MCAWHLEHDVGVYQCTAHDVDTYQCEKVSLDIVYTFLKGFRIIEFRYYRVAVEYATI